MDRLRRQPPMEGFQRPGSLGGEAFDNDEVEGHIMTDRTDQDTDTEGHRVSQRQATDDDDTEGHRASQRQATDDEDVEGHRVSQRQATDDDDTEGHKSLTR